MYKVFKPNSKYEFSLNGSYRKNGVEFIGEKNIDIDIHGVSLKLETSWLGLLAHYEINLSLDEIQAIEFVSCNSKVIGIKCGFLMVFTRPLQQPCGFYRIPGFTNFLISPEGVVKSEKSGNVLSRAIGPYGYPYVNIRDPDKSKWRSVSLHILLARVFVKNPDPFTRIFVNHKDGNKLNFELSNLEWVTSVGNQRHAVQNSLRKDNVPCKTRSVITQVVNSYPSIGQALEGIGLKGRDTKIYKRVNGEIIPSLIAREFEIKLANDLTPWYYNGTNSKDIVRFKNNGPFQAKKLADDSVIEAKTIVELSAIVKVSRFRIEQAIKSNTSVSCDGYVFKTKSTSGWLLNPKDNRYTAPRVMCLKNIVTNEKKYFSSFRKTCEFLCADKRTLKNRVLQNKPFGNWLLLYTDETQ